jgi:hypothetical protein
VLDFNNHRLFVEAPDGTVQPYAYKVDGELSKRRCLKFRKMMRAAAMDVAGRHLAHDTAACRHFQPVDNPPPVKKP